MEISEQEKNVLLSFQESEITEHVVYKKLAEISVGKNRQVLLKISQDELTHYNIWKRYTGKDIPPNRIKVLLYSILARILGLSFTAKLMEKNEMKAEKKYSALLHRYQEAETVLRDEVSHENLLLSMIEEKKVEYIGSMVLGLNDALVELSGTLAGLSFALRSSKLIGLAGIITGIAAALSMSAAEYLSQRAESSESRQPLTAAVFTGIAYIFTVVILVAPYLLLSNYLYALLWSIINGIFAILFFSFFVSVVKDRSFKTSFLEMFAINSSVILISFVVGLLVRRFLGVDI